MAPVVNTYGAKKKKRQAIPKYMFQDDDDVFEALSIQNIKEIKASLDEKTKQKLKRRNHALSKPLLSLGDYAGADADTTFDRLLNEGTIRPCKSLGSSANGSPPSSGLGVSRYHTLKCHTESLQKKLADKKCSHSKGKFKLERKNNKKTYSEDSFFTRRPVSIPAQEEQRQHLPISPILPLHSTSTPFGKVCGRNCEISPGFGNLVSGTISQQAQDVSVDLFASYEHQENENVAEQNDMVKVKVSHSHDEVETLAISCDPSPSRSSRHTPSVCESKDSNQTEQLVHYSVKTEDSCIILDETGESVNVGPGFRSDMKLASYSSVNMNSDQSDESSRNNSSHSGEISCIPASTCDKLAAVTFKDFRVLLQRCDIEGKLNDDYVSPFLCNFTNNSSKLGESHHVVKKSENPGHTLLECEVLLSRDDVPKLLEFPEKLSSSKVMNSTEDSQCSSAELEASSGALDNQARQNEAHPEIDCFLNVTCARPSLRQSSAHESIVLKPGKHWRRSLSILSKIRSSLDNSVNGKKSISCDDAKRKGKRWESTVNSIIHLQPAKEIIFEDIESSLGSLCLDETSARDKTVHINDDSVISVLSVIRSDIPSATDVLRRCGQDEPISFSKSYPQSMRKKCKKIGEGVYGEVFVYSESSNPVTVIKVIPIEGNMEVNGEPQKTFREIFSEIFVAQELSNLRSGKDNIAGTFNQVQAIRCVRGCYPEWLLELWHDYNNSKGSENDCPDMFQEDQLYIVLELSHGGKDLESFIFSSADQGLAAFKQIALTLAVAEVALSFEHRDLHWGNVLISNTKKKDIGFILNGESRSTPSKGVEVSIIDFTLSRINDSHTGAAVFYDLSKDETLFTAQGDYQFEIYRMMKEYCGNKWEQFTPKTNVAWLHYLLDKLCTMARYRNRSSKVHSRAIDVLSEMKDSVLMFDNVSSFVKSSFFCK